MESTSVLGLVGGTAVQAEESRGACALAEVSGYIPLADLASWVDQNSLGGLPCYYYIPTIEPASQSFTKDPKTSHYFTLLELRT